MSGQYLFVGEGERSVYGSTASTSESTRQMGKHPKNYSPPTEQDFGAGGFSSGNLLVGEFGQAPQTTRTVPVIEHGGTYVVRAGTPMPNNTPVLIAGIGVAAVIAYWLFKR